MWRIVVLLFVIKVFCVTAQSCTTPNGESARCTPIYSCQTFVAVLDSDDEDPEEFRYLRDSVCSNDRNGRPIVCCGSDTRYKSTGNSLLPDRNTCGYQADFKILGGEDTSLTEFPWMALLEKTTSTGVTSWSCGGSLISNRYVLTAAHCTVSPKNKPFSITKVRLGEHNLDKAIDCTGGGKFCAPAPQDIPVEQTVSHEGYVRSKQGVFNDIALVRLSREVNYSEFIKPICLPYPNERKGPGDLLHVAGWGATETTRRSAIKQKLQVPIVEFNVCKSKFGDLGVTINEKLICAGGIKGKDSCKGDSGGPLIGSNKNPTTDQEQYYIEGIVSYGVICGTEGFPGIYTRVTDHLDWISKNLRQ